MGSPERSPGNVSSTPWASISSTSTAATDLGDRGRGDTCPGAIRMYEASDGLIGRLRFPGGLVRARDWDNLAAMADELGDGNIHLTSRGNLQIRGVSEQQTFTERMTTHGYLPSPTHDLVRNIIRSPLAPTLQVAVQQLDEALLSHPELGKLSGRTLFAIDSGHGAIVAENPDFGAIALTGAFTQFRLVLGGEVQEAVVAADNLAVALSAAAQVWQEERGAAWRVREEPSVIPLIIQALQSAELLLDESAAAPAEEPLSVPETSPAPIGWIEGDDGLVSLGAGIRFGQLDSRLARFIAAVGADTTVTPWASIVIHDLAPGVADEVAKVLAPMGLVFDQASPWLRASACTGSPGCAKSLADVREDLTFALSSGQLPVLQNPEAHVHFVGCQRRCGHPNFAHTEYQATPDGDYDITERQ